MSEQALVVLCTCPDDPTARRIAEAIVAEQLAACVNIINAVRSVYRWQGKVETDQEQLLVIKTTAAGFDKLSVRVQALHPYELPEIIAVPIQHGLPGYLQWIADNTSQSS